jgi:hypothetical protein
MPRKLAASGLATKLEGFSGLSGVYMFFNPLDGESYVGSAKSPLYRLRDHRLTASSVIRKSKLSSPFYNYLSTIWSSWENIHWALLQTETLFEQEFGLQNPSYKLNSNELEILTNFSRFFVRLKEQVMKDLLKPSTNVDPVKITYNWKPLNLSVYLSKVYYEVVNAKTDELLFSSVGKIAIAHFMGPRLFSSRRKKFIFFKKKIKFLFNPVGIK